MKQGTLYGVRLKKTFAKLLRSDGAPPIPEPDNPMRRLALGVLGVHDGERMAVKALDRLLGVVVDWNDIRVSTASEAQAAVGDGLTDGHALCERLRRVLHSVFDKVNRLSLDHLKDMGRREARQYLEAFDGVDEYAAAGVVLWSLGGHAIPVDDRLLAALRAAELVHPEASRGDVQAFLERHVSAADAKTFCLVMSGFTAPKKTRKKAASESGHRKKTRSGGSAAQRVRRAKRVTRKS